MLLYKFGVLFINYVTIASERPASQMSILEQFLKETNMRRGGSLESEEGDVEDTPSAPSLASSKSYLSQVSVFILFF